MTNITWTNERRTVKSLIPWDKNPRKISDEQLAHLKRSIEKFNYAAPAVVNVDGRIIAGHMRLKAMAALGRGEEMIDVRVPSRLLTEAEAEELTIRDNANTGDWDFTLLGELDLDSLAAYGVSSDLVDRIRQKIKEDNFDAEAEYATIVTPKTKQGDVYILGNHHLLCGDSTNTEDFKTLLGGVRARLVFTDPPYSVAYKNDGGDSIKNDDLDPEKALTFYIKVLKILKDFTTDDASLYWWFANKMNWINRLAWIDAGWEMAQIIIWLKETMVFSLGQDYHICYEPVMFGWKVGQAHFKNKKIANYRDVFMLDKEEFSDLYDVWYERRDSTQDYVHPTQKPVRLAERALRKNSVAGDAVLDLFGGSGSTLMACEQMGRPCYLMELDPKYCDVIVARWERFTSQEAKRI